MYAQAGNFEQSAIKGMGCVVDLKFDLVFEIIIGSGIESGVKSYYLGFRVAMKFEVSHC